MKKGLRQSVRFGCCALAATEPRPYEEGIKTTSPFRTNHLLTDGAQTL